MAGEPGARDPVAGDSPAEPSEPEGAAAPRNAAELKDRRRAIQRAIRRREEPPAGLESLAMQVALRQSGLRWFVVLYAVGFVVEVASVFVENSVATQVRDGLIALAFLLLGYVQWQIGQRAHEAVDRWSRRSDEGRQLPSRRRDA